MIIQRYIIYNLLPKVCYLFNKFDTIVCKNQCDINVNGILLFFSHIIPFVSY